MPSTAAEIREKCRMFYLVKGHLDTGWDTIEASYAGYFRKVWYEYEGQDITIYEEGFEEAYVNFLLRRYV